jgi:uncharacterized heparinase superfamily protein
MRIDRVIALSRYHKPSQFAYRALHLVQNWTGVGTNVHKVVGLAPAKLKLDASETLTRMAERRLQLWPARHNANWLDKMMHGEFTYLNLTASLSRDGSVKSIVGGSVDKLPRLWWFHWHCQESLLELAEYAGPEASWKHISDWLDNPNHKSPLQDPNAWHPFCVSRRLPVWLMMASRFEIPDSIKESFWRAVHSHTAWLSRHLEWDLGGNHLLENLRTLCVAHAFLDSDELELATTESQLVRWTIEELEKQILPTGEHFERTPTYHALMLMSLIEVRDTLPFLSNKTSKESDRNFLHELEEVLQNAILAMQQFLNSILHPDGMIPLLGDSVFGETPSPRALIGTNVKTLGVQLSSTDYWVNRNESNCYLIFDHGDLACDHLPAHGHADLFTIEASWLGNRFVVDTGTFDYEDSESRQHCRGTASHNTLQIDGLNHADIWSRFRMGRRGHVSSVRQSVPDESVSTGISFCLASHDAYKSIGVPKVYRLIASLRDPASQLPIWLVVDLAFTKKRHNYRNPLHFHPDWFIESVDGEEGKFVCSVSGNREQVSIMAIGDPEIEDSKIAIEQSQYCPEFGLSLTNSACVQKWSKQGNTWSGWIISDCRGSATPNRFPKVTCDFEELEIRMEDGVQRIKIAST